MQSRTRLVIVAALAALAITPLSTVSAQHLADPAAAKLADSCQKAILKAGRAFAAKKLSRLDKCVDGILVCVQTKAPGDACRTKTAANCSKALASIADDELIADVEPGVGHVHVHLGRSRLAQHGAYVERRGPA